MQNFLGASAIHRNYVNETIKVIKYKQLFLPSSDRNSTGSRPEERLLKMSFGIFSRGPSIPQ